MIAHELVQDILNNSQGNFAMRGMSIWKQERLAEYYAAVALRKKDPTFTLSRKVEEYLNGGYDILGAYRQHYMRGNLLVSYLVEIRGFQVSEILKLSETEAALFASMLEWYQHSQRGQ